MQQTLSRVCLQRLCKEKKSANAYLHRGGGLTFRFRSEFQIHFVNSDFTLRYNKWTRRRSGDSMTDS